MKYKKYIYNLNLLIKKRRGFLERSLNPKSLESGFSIIEVIVAIFIVTLIGFAAYYFEKDVFLLNKIVSDSLTAQNEARQALKKMSSEIRTASPSSLGAYAIVQAGVSSFTFYSNIDDDSLKERVRYFLEGATLKKGVIRPSGAPLTYNMANEIISELVHNMANGAAPIFSYYDKNYDGTTQPLTQPIDIAAARLVKITIIIDEDSQSPPSPLTLTTQISMRNLKDNL